MPWHPGSAPAFDVLVCLSLPRGSAPDHSCPLSGFTGAPVSKDLFNFLLQGGVSNTQKMLPALPWTSGLRVLSTTDVSFSPLIPPLGPERVQALPAPISVNSLLLPVCGTAPRCQCHPRLAPPSFAKHPRALGERNPLPNPREGPAASPEPPFLARRCAEMAAQPL